MSTTYALGIFRPNVYVITCITQINQYACLPGKKFSEMIYNWGIIYLT
uniref:Uncharacterized protein n=1 Tax=Anguilla anguilla TaxID=7936 RepID=A0A0E9W6X8_ANGAN